MAATALIATRKGARLFGPRMKALATATAVCGISLGVVHAIALETKGQPVARFVNPSYVELRVPSVGVVATNDLIRAVEEHPYQMTGAVGLPVGSAVAAFQLSRTTLPLAERVGRGRAFGQLAVIGVALVAMIIRDRAMERHRFEKERAKWSAN